MITIDATNQKLGRVASKAAKILSGKESPAYERNAVKGDSVTIINASKADISIKKLQEKTYERYSGYPGGLVFQTLADMVSKKGYGEAFRLAIYGMLPRNRLRSIVMKKLTITE